MHITYEYSGGERGDILYGGEGGGGDSLLLKVRSKMSGKLMDRGHSLNILISFQSRGSKGNTSRENMLVHTAYF